MVRREDGLDEAVICNDYTNKITKHLVDVKDGCSIKRDALLLNKWIRSRMGFALVKIESGSPLAITILTRFLSTEMMNA